MKAQAIVLEGVERVALREVALPSMRPQDIVVKTRYSAVSVGTERWAFIGKRSEIKFPNVLGYMSVGEVTAVGTEAGKHGYREGGLVYFGGSRLAGDVEGNSWMSGHVSTAVVDVVAPLGNPEWFAVERVPEGVAAEKVTLASLCAVALRGIEMAVIPVGAKVLVCGLGVLGQFALQICRLKGARVCATDISAARCTLASGLGAEWVVNGKEENLAARAGEIAPDGFDIIIDTSSIAAVVNSLWPLLRFRGKFVFQGWYPPLTGLDLNAAHVRMPTAFFPCGYGTEAVASALRWMGEGKIENCRLVTHKRRPADCAAVCAMIRDNSEDFLGIVYDWTGF